MSNGIPAGLVATFSLAWTGDALPSGMSLGLIQDVGAQNYFDAYYRCALSFAFNSSFPLFPGGTSNSTYRGAEEHYLGHCFYEPSPEIGNCRLDAMALLLDDADGICTRLLQLHLKPIAATQECSSEFIGAFADYTRRFGWTDFPERKPARENDPALKVWEVALSKCRVGRKRKQPGTRAHALGHSYCLVFSLFDLDKDRFEARDLYVEEIYRLLYSHRAGVNTEIAKEEVGQGKGWSSTSFFESWFQPGAMVVLSCPHSRDDYRSNTDWFHATALDSPPNQRSANVDLDASSDGLRCYNDLPEYPPFRYVAPLVAIFGIFYEEVLRDTYERLIELHRGAGQNLFVNVRGLFGRSREIGYLTRRLARIDTLEHLRLPVSRPLGSKIFESKIQDKVVRAIDQLRAANTDTIGLTLSVVGVVLSFVGLVLSMFFILTKLS